MRAEFHVGDEERRDRVAMLCDITGEIPYGIQMMASGSRHSPKTCFLHKLFGDPYDLSLGEVLPVEWGSFGLIERFRTCGAEEFSCAIPIVAVGHDVAAALLSVCSALRILAEVVVPSVLFHDATSFSRDGEHYSYIKSVVLWVKLVFKAYG